MLTTAAVKSHNNGRQQALSQDNVFNESKDSTFQKNLAAQAQKKKTTIGSDGKSFQNTHLQDLSEKYDGCVSLKSKAAQNEWLYVRKDFGVVAENSPSKNRGATKLKDVVDRILASRQATEQSKNSPNTLKLGFELVKLKAKAGTLGLEHNKRMNERNHAWRLSHPDIFKDEPTSDKNNLIEKAVKNYKNKKVKAAHEARITKEKHEIAQLKERIKKKLASMNKNQKKMLQEVIQQAAAGDGPNNAIEIKQVLTKPDFQALMHVVIVKKYAEHQTIRRKLDDANRDLNNAVATKTKTKTELHHKTALHETCTAEADKQLKLEMMIDIEKKNVASTVQYCATYKTQVENMQIAIQHELRMKELSTLNPVSMLDFYAKRVTGVDDSTHSVLMEIKSFDAQDKVAQKMQRQHKATFFHELEAKVKKLQYTNFGNETEQAIHERKKEKALWELLRAAREERLQELEKIQLNYTHHGKEQGLSKEEKIELKELCDTRSEKHILLGPVSKSDACTLEELLLEKKK